MDWRAWFNRFGSHYMVAENRHQEIIGTSETIDEMYIAFKARLLEETTAIPREGENNGNG